MHFHARNAKLCEISPLFMSFAEIALTLVSVCFSKEKKISERGRIGWILTRFDAFLHPILALLLQISAMNFEATAI